MNRQPDCSTLRHADVQIRRMWEGGPLRQWSERRTSQTLKDCLVSWSMFSMCCAVDPSAINTCSRELHLSGSLRGLVQHRVGQLSKEWPKSGVAPSCN